MPRGRKRTVRELTPALIAGYKSGRLSGEDIAKRLGCSQPWALQLLQRAGVDTTRNRAREPSVTIPPAVVRLYRARKIGLIEVAAAAGCSRIGARKALLRAGVPMNPRRAIEPRPGKRLAGVTARRHLSSLLRWLETSGYTTVKIAEVLGIPPSTVAYFRRLDQ